MISVFTGHLVYCMCARVHLLLLFVVVLEHHVVATRVDELFWHGHWLHQQCVNGMFRHSHLYTPLTVDTAQVAGH